MSQYLLSICNKEISVTPEERTGCCGQGSEGKSIRSGRRTRAFSPVYKQA